MNIFKTPELENLTRLEDNRYSAFGKINGRPFVADADTWEEAQALRQELKDEVLSREAARPDCLRNVTFIEKERTFKARPNEPFTPPPNDAA